MTRIFLAAVVAVSMGTRDLDDGPYDCDRYATGLAACGERHGPMAARLGDGDHARIME